MTVRDLVLAIFERAAKRKPQPFRYRFSSAGDPCLRALVYDAQDADDGKQPVEGKSEIAWTLSAACGNAVGYALEQAAVETGGFVRQVFAEFDTGSVWVRGDADFADRATVYDWKLVGEKKWAKIQSKPDPKHELQIQGYAVALDRKRWALIYVSASSIFEDGAKVPEFIVHEGAASVERAQELCGVWEQVEGHRKLRTLPERVWGASPRRWPCGWCRHLERCGPVEQEQDNA